MGQYIPISLWVKAVISSLIQLSIIIHIYRFSAANSFVDMVEKFHASLVIVTHNLGIVARYVKRICVMYAGRIVESGPTKSIFSKPCHPYTKALLSAVPIADPFVEEVSEKFELQGAVPSPLNPPSGCSYHPRCSMASAECSQVVPPLVDRGEGHMVPCIKV